MAGSGTAAGVSEAFEMLAAMARAKLGVMPLMSLTVRVNAPVVLSARVNVEGLHGIRELDVALWQRHEAQHAHAAQILLHRLPQ